MILFYLLILSSLLMKSSGNKYPNIVFILTDDQDVELGGKNPITKAQKLIGDAGITFENMYVTSPLCCPSRSSILTGNYVHNHGALNNSLSGNCSSQQWQNGPEKNTFAKYLKKQGYRTFFAGKYLNQYGDRTVGGVKHIPPGWDEWNGLVGNSRYYNYTISVNGKEEKHGDKYPDDYLTNLIGKRAQKFLEWETPLNKPFFMMLSTPACHAPFTPAPQYSGNFSSMKAPRNGSFNVYAKDKHWLLRHAKHPLSNVSLKYIDTTFRNRWRTLLSVDDIVEDLVNTLKKHAVLQNTYIFFASDNGFHLGQFSLPNDKRQLYEFDIHVPLMVRGPGIVPAQRRKEIILNIDLAPTFIALSGSKPPSQMDGESFVQLLQSNKSVPSWREDFMVEHTGEYHSEIKGCPQYKNANMGNCVPDCVCEDSKNNTYSCVRTISDKANYMYCEFADSEQFTEFFDLKKDPHQLSNIATKVDPKILAAQNKRLVSLTVCKGPTCRQSLKPNPHPPDSPLKHF